MRNRRGLSTVIGIVFFVIAATTVITYISYSMNSIDQFAQSVIVSESQNIDRGREGITISQVTIDNGKFNMTVTNTGSLPVHLTRLWVTNQDGVTGDQKVDLDINLNPGQQEINIGQSAGIFADSAESYNLKVVTERGNISTFQVSTNTSTRIQLITPGTVAPGEDFKVISLITNNSTTPNNIANLVPTVNHTGSTMTLVNGPNPSSVASLPQGNTAAFTWTYTASQTTGLLSFNGSYVGAPTGSFTISNTTNRLSTEAEAASQSQWSQAASRVGILISGIPNPMNSANPVAYGKFGIGIINPLDRDVEIYAVGILFQLAGITNAISEKEPTSGWTIRNLGTGEIIVWEGGDTPIIIPGKSVGQFRVEIDLKSQNLFENIVLIQALTSEGKLSVQYTIASDDTHPLINAFYSTSASSPTTTWTYILEDLKSQKNDQIINATIQNSGSTMFSKVKLLILVPADFTDIQDITNGTGGWNAASIFQNPDGSNVIKVETSSSSFLGGTSKTYQFSVDNPLVNEDKLYVFQTTTIYPSFTGTGQSQLASALSEAGVEVIP